MQFFHALSIFGTELAIYISVHVPIEKTTIVNGRSQV